MPCRSQQVKTSTTPLLSQRNKVFVNRKIPKNLDAPKHNCNHPKIPTKWLLHRVRCPEDADRMANSADPDQTAPLEAV